MRTISFWARHHKAAARLSLVVLKIILAYMAFFVGSSLSDMNIAIPQTTGIVAVLLFGLIMAIYPSQTKSIVSKRAFYIKQKSCDFLLAASTFLLMICITNTNLYTSINSPSFANTPAALKTEPPSAEEILKSLEHRDKKSLTRQEKRILKQEFNKQLKVYAKAKIAGNKNEWGKAGMVFLTIIGALGVLYLVAALSCSLSCSGAEGAALAVAILGLAGIILGSIAIIKRISRGPKKKIPEPVVQ